MYSIHVKHNRRTSSRGSRVREPVQVYLDPADRGLLEELAQRTGLPRAEVLRRGLRRLADEVRVQRAPGWSLDLLTGALGNDPTLPGDLAARHDAYLYGPAERDDPGPD